MRPAILDFDGSVTGQARTASAIRRCGGRSVLAADLARDLRLWGAPGALDRLRARLGSDLPAGGQPDLVFAGSGDFHHVTPVLLERALAAFGGPVTVVHFDNHPDWVRFAAGSHCGSWVGAAARLPNVAKVITVGVCSRDIGGRRAQAGDLQLIDEARLDMFAWREPEGRPEVVLHGRAWPTITAIGEAAFLDLLAQRIPTRRIYVTIDKDVLGPEDAVTNWDQGAASLAFLEAAIRCVVAGRQIIGADVVGDWSRPAYGPGPLCAVLKAGEAWLDQPRHTPAAARVGAVNEATNLRLLEAFERAAA